MGKGSILLEHSFFYQLAIWPDMFERFNPVVFFLILLLIPLTGIQGQGWERAYGSPLDDAANQVLKTLDGGFIFIGTTIENDSTSRDIYLVKTDINGQVQWSKTIGTQGVSEFGNAIAALPDGYITASNAILDGYSRILLTRTDLSGNTLWSQLSPDDSVGVRAVGVTADGFAILGAKYKSIPDGNGGSLFDSDLLAIKTDWNGIEEWRYTYGGDQLDEGYDLHIDTNQNLILAGFTKSFGAGDFDAVVIQLDANGQEIWANTYGDSYPNLAFALTPVGDTAYAITGQYNAAGASGNDIFLAKIKSDGQEEWFIDIPDAAVTIARGISTTPSGAFLITGETQVTANDDRNAFLTQIDAQGNLIWQRTYGGALGDTGKDVITSNPTTFLIAGSTRSLGAGNSDAYLVHTDSLGNSFPGRLSGKVFFDEDLDCVSSGSEAGVPQTALLIEGEEKFYLYTDTSGHFSLNLDTGSYLVTAIPPAPYFEGCFADSLIQINPGYDSVNLDIPLQAIYDCSWLQTSISTPFLRRCFPNTYFLNYQNLGTVDLDSAYTIVTLDPYLTLDSATASYTDLGQQQYQFDLGQVDVFESGTILLYTTLDCDSTVTGQTHCVEAHSFPDSLCLPINPVWDGSSVEVLGSCQEDSVKFIIRNTGMGDMTESLDFLVIEDQIMGYQGDFQLPSLTDTSIVLSANGATFRLQAEQSNGHPIQNEPSVTVEGCGEDPFSIGYVIQHPQDDPQPWLDIDCQESIGSFDPNDKLGFPRGYSDQHFIRANTDIEYLIRFQNTGTDTAFLVVIRDTLDAHLDYLSFRPGVASHPYTFTMEPGGIAVFTFENILLPDSTSNEQASHGFVKFRIAQQPNNPDGTIITNRVAIYFDFNAPVITNMTYHQIGSKFIIVDLVDGTSSIEQGETHLKVFPNPAKEVITFEIDEHKQGPFLLQVFDAKGRAIMARSFKGRVFLMDALSLVPGFYFFHLKNDNGWHISGKIAVIQ